MSQSKKISFQGASGADLAAVLQMPTLTPRGYALFAHCFTCTKDIFAARQISNSLAEHGLAVMRFDFTGLGESEGEFASSNFSSNVADLVAAAKHLSENYGPPRVLIGHSLGGAAVLAAAGEISEVRAVCTVGAPAEPAHVEHLFTERSEEIRAQGQAEVLLAGRPFVIQRQFLDDIAKVSLIKKIRNLNKALLIFHSPNDTTVEISNARNIYEAASHPKSFVSLDGADHLLTRPSDAAYVALIVSAWADRYLNKPRMAASVPDQAEASEVVVEEAGGTGLAQLIVNGKHELIADEPGSVGGGNAGPTPYGLLLAALGACTTMTLRLYAQHKKLPLKLARVRLSHSKIHAADCSSCETNGGSVDKITRSLELVGDLSPEQRQRLLEISEKCPVHRSLHSTLEISTTLVN